MDWRIDDYFPLLDSFRHKALFDALDAPWEALTGIGEEILNFIDGAEQGAMPGEDIKELSLQEIRDGKGGIVDRMILVKRAFRCSSPVVFKEFGVCIGKGTLLEPTAVIKPPVLIGAGCEIRQGAYFRGNVILGDHSTIGHATEIKNSIMMNHSEAGHFSYIGDSIIGSRVNLGAGTKLANLQFRGRNEKEEGTSRNIIVRFREKLWDTGLRKLGAIIGDYTELGCNSVTSPGVLLGCGSWVSPNKVVTKGIYPAVTRIK